LAYPGHAGMQACILTGFLQHALPSIRTRAIIGLQPRGESRHTLLRAVDCADLDCTPIPRVGPSPPQAGTTMRRFLAKWISGGQEQEPAARVGPDLQLPEPLLSAAPIHVLRDDGLVRLVDGHLSWQAADGATEQVRLDEVAQLSLFGNAGVTSPCVRELIGRGVPVIWRSPSGHYVGQTADLSGGAAAARRAQYRAADDPARRLAIARVLVEAKIVNARALLRHGDRQSRATMRELSRLAKRTASAPTPAALLGIEGAAAAAMYAVLPQLVSPARREDFPWDGRRRRPPTDPMNALLSYLYAILAGECAAAALAAGLDPAIGFLHAERPGRPALALDLMEPFRPALGDSVALAVVNRGEARPPHFERTTDGVRLNGAGRRVVLAALERRLADPVPASLEKRVRMNWREAVVAQARRLARALVSDQPFRCFEP
jgi:CRISPR-associated protein Cas1